MLTKLEHKSSRVKGLAFHPFRPWILASLHNGTIELIDYAMETVIERYSEHEGPVRGVNFHSSQPLFVSGGDDYKVKVWDYQKRKCLFTLLGHLDYIRTVEFHQEYPWILSASDDQTLRLWNWQSRSCIAVLTGHNHYVMCARFHPKEDIMVSASLDQTIRVWDISGLTKKTVSIAPQPERMASAQSTDLFGTSGVVVKYVLEGHTRGVNWVAFHKKMPLIVSGADDREVKLWRMSETKAWEVDTMRGHINNVSSVIFHPGYEIIVSNSEDKSIRVWDMSRQSSPQIFRRETDRYWILAAHPTNNLMAAGHDSGLVVFKLERQRPAFDTYKDILFYCKDRYLRAYNHRNKKDIPMFSLRSSNSNSTPCGIGMSPRTVYYNHMNPSEHNFLVISDVDSGTYELYTKRKDENRNDDSSSVIRGLASHAVFVSRNRFAVLDHSRQVYLKNFDNETKRKIDMDNNIVVTGLFSAGIGRLILRAVDRVLLFDLQSKKVIYTLMTQSRYPVRYVQWSKDRKYVAFLSKFVIYITNSRLEELCTVNETGRVKSGAWDASGKGVFYYTTSTHLKFSLVSGDSGIIRTLDSVVYLTSVDGPTVSCLDRQHEQKVFTIQNVEALFKKSLLDHNLEEVLRIVKSGSLVGQSLIAYLQKKGYPEVALQFVQDLSTKFSLALQCGDTRSALDCALKLPTEDENGDAIDNSQYWEELASESLRRGDQQIVELCYQKMKSLEKLSFLYLITGQLTKLSKMSEIAKGREDLQSRFHNSVFTGDVQTRVDVLKASGNMGLAVLTALAHNLPLPFDSDDDDEETRLQNEEIVRCAREYIEKGKGNARFMFPPFPLVPSTNWPHLDVERSAFDGIFENQESDNVSADESEVVEEELDVEGWGSDIEIEADEDESPTAEPATTGWGDDDLGSDLEVSEDDSDAKSPGTEEGNEEFFMMPLAGKSVGQQWVETAEGKSAVRAHILNGHFDSAMDVLHSEHGIVNFAPLKKHFIDMYESARVEMPLIPNCPSLQVEVAHALDDVFTLSHCESLMEDALALFSEGSDLPSALNLLRDVLAMTCFLDNHDKNSTSLEVVRERCREYIVGLRLELARREENGTRAMELAGLFTQCELLPEHVALGLRVAIKCALKIKNYRSASTFCRRYLEMSQMNNFPRAHVQKVKQALKACEKKDSNKVRLLYDSLGNRIGGSAVSCSASFTILDRSNASRVIDCAFCKTKYLADYGGELCKTCLLCKIG